MSLLRCPVCGSETQVPDGGRAECVVCGHGRRVADENAQAAGRVPGPAGPERPVALPTTPEEPRARRRRRLGWPAWVGLSAGAAAILVALVAALR